MLSAIENGLIDCTPKWAIYQVLSGHVARSAGYGSWDKHGPKYILRNGQLTRNGHFDDSIKKGIFNQLEKSHFYRIFVKDRYTITDNDIKIFLEIVDTSRRKLVEKYPEIEFHVILWNKMPDDATYLKVRNGLKSLSIKFHLVSDMLPDFFEDIEKYEISTYDKHPNPIAHQMIAEYVVNNIMEIKNPHKSD
jgi:hypothetical protein